MKALTFHGTGHVAYESVDDPRLLAPTDVIVKVTCCAICGSDLHVYHGHEKGMDGGTAMGHEFSGELVEVGQQVRVIEKGDLVMSPFTTNCGECFYCKTGLTCRCTKGQLYGWVEKGKGLPGGQAEFVRVPLADSTLMKIQEGVSAEEGMMLGDIISTGFFCAHQAEIKPTNTYVVVGCGPVGLMAILGAREYGAENIFAIDTVEARLAHAGKFGAQTVSAASQNAVALIKDATDGRGADAVMEAVGNRQAGVLAYDLVRPGGIISQVGVCNDVSLPFSPVQAYDKNLSYKVGRCPARYFMDKLAPLVQQRKYDFTSIITHRMSLSEGVNGYDIFAGKKDNCLKVVLNPA